MTSVPRIGIDAMGGDFGPRPVAEGAALALREWPGRFRLTLVGDDGEIRGALRHAHLGNADITVVHASEKVDMAAKAADMGYRGKEIYDKAKDVSVSSFSDTTALPATTYYYIVRTIDTAGN